MLNIIKITEGDIDNWTGTISSITTSHGGKMASVSILSSNNVVYRNEVDVRSGTALYEQLSNLKDGQSVKFTGILVKKFSTDAEAYEGSLT